MGEVVDVSVLIPVKGRHEQTLALIPRLIESAGIKATFIMVVDEDQDLASELTKAPFSTEIGIMALPKRVGYWKALSAGMQYVHTPLVVHLANDILPGKDWLSRAVGGHRNRFGSGDGIVGLNDGIHTGSHAGHLLINTGLLHRWYGDRHWPVCYDHLYGDTELCHRAIEEKIFVVHPWAVVYHNHPVTGGTNDDLYRFSHTHLRHDRDLFLARKRAGWPAL